MQESLEEKLKGISPENSERESEINEQAQHMQVRIDGQFSQEDEMAQAFYANISEAMQNAFIKMQEENKAQLEIIMENMYNQSKKYEEFELLNQKQIAEHQQDLEIVKNRIGECEQRQEEIIRNLQETVNDVYQRVNEQTNEIKVINMKVDELTSQISKATENPMLLNKYNSEQTEGNENTHSESNKILVEKG